MDRRLLRDLLLFQTILTAVRLVLALALELSADEAYYWLWSQQPAGWYFDHPPMIAWWISAGTLFSNHELFVRLPTIIAAVATSLTCYAIARELGSDHGRGLSAVALLDLSLLGLAGGVIATPDSPFLLFSALSLLCLLRLRHNPTAGGWLQLGLTLGLAGMSKHAAALLLPVVLVSTLSIPALRRQLRTPWPWLAGILGVIVVGPLLLGEWQHGFAGFEYQGRRALSSRGAFWESMPAYITGQFGLLGPFTFISVTVALVRVLRRGLSHDRGLQIACYWTLLIWGYLLLRSLLGFVEPNWAGPSYLAAIPLLAAAQSKGLGPNDRWFVRSVIIAGVSAVIVVGIVLAGPLPLPCKMEPTHRVRHWRALAADLDRKAPNTAILVRRYQVGALIRYYGGKREIAVNRLGWRRSQLDYWPSYRPKPGTRYLMVDVRAVKPALLKKEHTIIGTPKRIRAPGTICTEWIAQPVRNR